MNFEESIQGGIEPGPGWLAGCDLGFLHVQDTTIENIYDPYIYHQVERPSGSSLEPTVLL